MLNDDIIPEIPSEKPASKATTEIHNDNQIEYIEGGHTDVLIVAPHVVMGDDDRTDIVASSIANKLNCSALM